MKKYKRLLSFILIAVALSGLIPPISIVKAAPKEVFSISPSKLWQKYAFSDGDWRVYVDGKSKGTSWAFGVVGTGHFNFVNPGKVRYWAEEMKGNPNYVSRMVTDYVVTNKDTGQKWDLIWIRDIADYSGADVDWDSSKKRVYIEPSDPPDGYIDCPDTVQEGDEIDISISGNFYKGKNMDWELRAGRDYIDGGSVSRKLSENVSHVFDRAGNVTLELELTDEFERTTVVKKKIKVEGDGGSGGSSGIVASFDIDSELQVGQRAFAEDQSYTESGKITDWIWTIGNTGANMHPNAVFEQTDTGAYFTFNKAGKYEIRLTIQNSRGQEASTRRTVRVVTGGGGDNPDDGKVEPTVSLVINKNRFLRGETAQFTAEINPNDFQIVEESWDIFNPNTGDILKHEKGIIHKALTLDMPEGDYAASQSAFFVKNGSRQEKSKIVWFEIVKPEPLVADFVADPWEQIIGEKIKLINNSTGYTEEEWYIRKSGTNNFTKLTLNSENKFTKNEVGLYDVKLIVRDESGKQAEKIKQVRFKDLLGPLAVDFEAIPTKAPIGQNIKLINNSTGYTKEEWYIKKAQDSNWEKLYLSSEKTFTEIEVGKYDVKLIISNDIEEKSMIKQVEFTEINNLKAFVSVIPPKAYVGQPIKINNNSFGNYSNYQWYVDGQSVSWPKLGTTITEYSPTIKNIRLEIQDDNGNIDSATTTATWTEVSLKAKIAASKTTAIEGDTIYISNHSTGDYDDWTWEVNGQTKTWGRDGGMIIAEEGNTTISLTIRHNKTGKTDTDTVTITAEKPNIPPKAVIISPDYIIRGENIDIKDLSYDTDGEIVNRSWIITGVNANKYTSNLKTDGSGGSIIVDEFTTITVKLTVTDNKGATDTDIKQIIVGGNEPPEIKVKESGTKKQNRKYSIDLSESITGKYYEIDWDKTIYDVTPISESIEQDSIKYVKYKKGIDLLFKEPGTYKIRILIEDTGKRYDSKELEIVIAPDAPPVNNVFLQNANIYRDEPVKIAKEIYSPDNDIIKIEDIKIFYDSNNDGIFDDEDGEDISDKKSLTFNKVGRYKIVSFVKEEFGQETIEEFVIEDDRKSTMFETIIKVDNRPPTAEIKADIPSKKEKVDLLILADSKLDNGSKYYYTKTNKDLPNRNYIRNNLTDINNKLAVKNIDAKTFKKDFKVDVYEKDISENHNYHYYNKNDDNLPNTVQYSDKQGYNGTLHRQPGVTWTTKYANVTTNFTKYRYKDAYSINNSIFEENYYVNEDKNVLVNPSTGYRKNVHFSGNIPRTNVSWSARYNYDSKTVTETEVKNNATQDNSIFDSQKWYSQGGYSGYLSRKSVEWEDNCYTKFVEVNAIDMYELTKIWDGTNWQNYRQRYVNYPDGYPYEDKDGYQGVLSRQYPGRDFDITNYPYPQNPSPGDIYISSEVIGMWTFSGEVKKSKGYMTGTATYQGTVTKSTFSHYAGTATYNGSLYATTTDGYYGEANYQGTAYKYVPDDSEPDWRLESKKYILYVADNNEVDNISQLRNYQQKTGAKVIFIGDTEYSGAVKNIRYTDLRKNIEEAIEFIAVEEELESRDAVLINEEEFVLETEESDPENDRITERVFKYEHDENFYMNPEGKSSLPSIWSEYKPTYLDKPGKYIISYKVKDQATEDPKFDDYNKYSNIAQIILFGHRRPIVTDFNVNFKYNPSTRKYEEPVFMVEAYDPDYYDINTRKGRSDKGIVEYAYKWKKKGENEYKYGIPKELDSGTYIFQVLARDIDDAWSLPFEKEITLTDVGFILKGILEPEEGKFSLSKIPASEELKVTSIETIHAYTVDSVEFSLYKGSSSKTPKRILEYPQDVKTKDKSHTQWTQIRAYQIPETLPDGDYIATLTGKSSHASASLQWNVKVVTPIDLVPNVPAELYIDENNRIRATTSKYVNKVTFKFNNKNYNMSLVNIEDKKEWQYDIFLQEGFPLGKYDVTITATTPNGNKETKTVQVLVEDPLDIIGDSDKDVYRAGQAMLLSAETEGRASKVEAKMWYPKNEYSSTNVTTLVPDTTLTDPPQKFMTWHSRRTKEEGRDIVVIIPLNTPDGTYPVTFTAFKRKYDGGTKTATHTVYVKVQGTIYDGSKSQIIGR